MIYPADIPDIPDRERRLEALLVDCYGEEEELAALDVYLSDGLRPPFPAIWREAEEGTAVPVVVRGVAGADEPGARLRVERGGRPVVVPAEQVWAAEPGRNATVLDDYRHWRDELGGIPEDDVY